MIRKGEYDLVNMSFIGFDPNTGRSFDDCYAEWEAEKARVLDEWESLRWWQVIKNIRLRWQMVCLIERRGY